MTNVCRALTIGLAWGLLLAPIADAEAGAKRTGGSAASGHSTRSYAGSRTHYTGGHRSRGSSDRSYRGSSRTYPSRGRTYRPATSKPYPLRSHQRGNRHGYRSKGFEYSYGKHGSEGYRYGDFEYGYDSRLARGHRWHGRQGYRRGRRPHGGMRYARPGYEHGSRMEFSLGNVSSGLNREARRSGHENRRSKLRNETRRGDTRRGSSRTYDYDPRSYEKKTRHRDGHQSGEAYRDRAYLDGGHQKRARDKRGKRHRRRSIITGTNVNVYHGFAAYNGNPVYAEHDHVYDTRGHATNTYTDCHPVVKSSTDARGKPVKILATMCYDESGYARIVPGSRTIVERF